jgi:multidrug efflux pump subunit AcrA (membrane-fusion protein)
MHKFFTGILALGFLIGACSEDRESVQVKKRDIVESVYSSVVVEPADMYKVNALNSGYIDEILVDIGDTVNFGDVLFAVRDVQSNSTASNAYLALQIARSNYKGDVNLLDDLRLEMKDAALKLRTDSLNYFRNKKLYDQGVLTEVELTQSEVVYSASQTRYKLLKNRLTRTKGDLKASLNQAMNNYASTLSRSNDALVRNRIRGQVYDLFKETGEFVSVQEPVLIVGSKDQFILKMKVDEVDITKIAVGQRIVVSLEAYKKKTFDAEVSHISPKMDMQTQTFEIEGVFTEMPPQLYMGLTGEGNIVINERKDVLVIPREYLIDDTYVITDDGKKKVSVGATSLSHVEITSGIKEGIKLYKTEL